MDLILNVTLMAALIAISYIDLKEKIIPDKLVNGVLILGIVKNLTDMDRALDGLIGLLLAGGILLTIAIISKGGIGGGDIKLVSAVGLCLGWKKVLLLLTLSTITGAITLGILMLVNVHKANKPIPLGPFIALSTFVVIAYGNNIINWYVEAIWL